MKHIVAASASSFVLMIEVIDAKPTTTSLRAVYFWYACSSPLNSGVKPQWLAVLTINSGLPAPSVHSVHALGGVQLEVLLIEDGRTRLGGGRGCDYRELRHQRYVQQCGQADERHCGTVFHPRDLAFELKKARYFRSTHAAFRPYAPTSQSSHTRSPRDCGLRTAGCQNAPFFALEL